MKIPDKVRKCVAYLYYKTKKNREPIGTVFFVVYEIEVAREGSKIDLMYWTYAITSRHVIEKIKAKGVDHITHFALNRKDGRIEWLETPVSEWQFPSGPRSDVAILEIELDRTKYDHLFFPQRGFLTHKELNEWGLGVGDELYFSGLFSKRPGDPANIPIIRIGNIAALPAGIIKTRYSDINAYLVEARSIGGLSGSPVFCSYRGIGAGGGRQNREYEPPDAAEGGLFLLGYVQGHYDENEAADLFNMGIALVVPVTDIIEALEHPPFVEARKRELEEARQELANENMGGLP